jgi:hypothetical protein
MPVKSFRGKLADLATETIHLHTNNGSTGYRIKKLEIMSAQPGVVDESHVVQIFTVPQTDTSTYDNIDFSDPTLLASAFLQQDDQNYNPGFESISFDNKTFNQDIFVTHADVKSTQPINYHIELEQVTLDLNENTVATLQDIRNIESQ